MTGHQYHITEAGLNRIKAEVQKQEMLKKYPCKLAVPLLE